MEVQVQLELPADGGKRDLADLHVCG